jgi:hypothetical protein
MSTSVTQYDCQIVVYQQKELLSGLDYWLVEVWKDFDQLRPDENEKIGKARCLMSIDNMDWDAQAWQLTNDTLESLISKATEFIREQTEKGI